MTDTSSKPWSNDSNAPNIPPSLYVEEKANFAAVPISGICYGIIIVLFFQCMGALCSPANGMRGGIKWGLVAHTLAMFSLVTISVAMNCDIQSISYIEDRKFPGNAGGRPTPGPLGYQSFIYAKAISVVPNVAFQLNNWLADGLLLYRCYLIYSRNYWAIAFPFLMYLASLVIGIMLTCYQTLQAGSSAWASMAIELGTPYYAISFSLNALLTLMIVTRLILHTRKLRSAAGGSARTAGLYRAVISMFVDSSALYAVAFILFIGPWSVGSWATDVFFPILAAAQVIAPFLITLRVANRSALMSDTDTYENSGPLRFGGQEKLVGSNGSPSTSSTDTCEGSHSTVVNTMSDFEALDRTS